VSRPATNSPSWIRKPTPTAAAYLTAATAPRPSPDTAHGTADGAAAGGEGDTTAAGDTRTVGQRRHDALIEALRQALAGGGLPSAGGIKPRIVITIPFTSLRDRTGAGRLSDGTPISPSLTRHLAEDSDLVPVWLSQTGIPLDVGRTVRLFTGRIRTALETRDRGCAWPGCDRPPSWAQAHHIRAPGSRAALRT